ncbi:MAG: hypothetical protein HYT80_09735 [Euryarchaeota archaeon]|nr:hypothetical protein [Euryarchaeota archaeon]
MGISSGLAAGLVLGPQAAAPADDSLPTYAAPPAPSPSPPSAREPPAGASAVCEVGASRLVVEPPLYIGWPILFRLEDAPCLVRWTLDFGDGSGTTENESAVEHRFAGRGTFPVAYEATFPDGRSVRGEERVTVLSYHPPSTPGDAPRGPASYREAPRFPASNLSFHWYLDNGLDWYNQPYSQISWNAWDRGAANATYAHGQGGVTLHVLPLYDGSPFAERAAFAQAWIMKARPNPTDEVPPCHPGYRVDMPSYAVSGLGLPSGWGFRSQVMGCGHDLFVPGETDVGFCIEWDGELLEGARPYMDGYITDTCDVQMHRRI